MLTVVGSLIYSASSFSSFHTGAGTRIASVVQRSPGYFPQRQLGSRHQRSQALALRPATTALQSAKILPVAYASASAALIFRATQLPVPTSKQDAAVLVATALIAAFNLGPTDNARLASAKKADNLYPPASSGVAKQRRQSAKTWRSVVRIKLIGQLVGLLWMALAKTSNGRLLGGATIMAANMAFFLCGAGAAMHDDKGEYAPMDASKAQTILSIDATLAFAAIIAVASPMPSPRRTLNVAIYVGGVSMGALEGIANLVASRKK